LKLVADEMISLLSANAYLKVLVAILCD
jgi:hypothetical protein